MNRLFILIFIILLYVVQGITQSSYAVVQAKKLHKKGLYKSSCDLYSESLDGNYDIEKTLLVAADACYRCAEYGKSRRFISQIRNTQKKYNEELFYQTARLFHLEGEYDSASKLYKEFLKKASKRSDLRDEVKRQLNYVWTAKRLQKRDKLALLQNAGSSINTSYDDRFPLPSPTVLNKYYFSRSDPSSIGGLRDKKGKSDKPYSFYRMDILSAQLQNGVWSEVSAINPFFNSTMHDYIIDFSQDGQTMFYYQGLELDNGRVLVDTFKDERSAITERYDFNGDFGSDFDYVKEDIIIFSAELKGGYGGRDLYMTMRVNGRWSNPKNLGSSINGSGDEISPFVAKNQRTLYFSSNDKRSMGGFDIMRSTFSILDNKWDEAVNLGRGTNSAADDLDYRLAADGSLALLSSNRKEGLGGFDIYMAYLNDQAIEQLQSSYVFDIGQWYLGKVESKVKQVEITSTDTGQEAEVVDKKASWKVNYLLFKDDDFTKKKEIKDELARIEGFMKRNPNARLIVEGHTDRLKSDAKNYYFSAIFAKQVKEQLVRKKVASNRIIVRAYGSRRPAVKSTIQNLVSDKWNNRIQFRIIQSPLDSGVKLEYKKPSIPQEMAAGTQYDVFTGLQYNVLAVASDQIVSHPYLMSVPGMCVEQRSGSKLSYVVGDIRTYARAKEILSELQEAGFVGAEIHPYVAEERLSLERVNRLSNRYPDLKEYIRDQD